MPFCQKCGAELSEDENFCPSCGTAVGVERIARPRPSYSREKEACFGPKGSGGGLWGAISGGVFLIGLAVLWYFDLWWPGILILVALMIIIGSIVAYSQRI